jgi:hypothetical protein
LFNKTNVHKRLMARNYTGMNKTKQIVLGRKVQLSATFFALMILFGACKKEESEIGSDLQGEGLGVSITDTFALVTYPELIDSMESDETSVNLLGAYNDPIFGGVNCGFVTQIVPEALTQSFPSLADLTMDSVVLSLRFASINYYANLEDITVEVYEIDDVLQRDDQTYYTFDTPTIVGSNLVLPGAETITPDFVKSVVVGTDTLSPQLRIHLDPSVGLDLVADSQAGLMGSNFATSTFKGLYVRVAVDDDAPDFGLGAGEGTVLYFSLEELLSRMTIYYHNTLGVYGDFDFNINSTCARYNLMEYDRSGTAIQAALDNPDLGQQAFYTQGGAIRAVVELPNITNFYTNAGGEFDPKIINRAVLILPIQDFQTDPFDPSTALFLARIVDAKLSTFTNDYGFGSSLSGNTVTYDEDNKEFRFSMTREIQGLLNGDFDNVGYRIYAPAFFASTVERIIFNGPDSDLKDRPRLEITYTDY